MKVLTMYEPRSEHVAALRRVAPEATVCSATDAAEASRLIVDAEVVLGNRYFLQSLPYAEHLRWMQSNSMGVDLILTAGDTLRNVKLTCARGLYSDEIADHALALLLALSRQVHVLRDDQRERRWRRHTLRTLAGGRALILGWGSVGQAVARRLTGFGVEVRAARRGHRGAPAVDATGTYVHGPGTWRDALPDSDFLIAALPLTGETYHLVDDAVTSQLPEGAFLVNVGRGSTVDDHAVVNALQDGRLSGAALDVLEREPLDASDSMWSVPGLLISPHVARSLERPPFRWESLFVENLRRYTAGEPLLNIVDQSLGY